MTYGDHPAELAQLDLFEVWTGVSEMDGEFDPFRFEHRMAAYRRLIDATNQHGLFGVDNRENPLWGLMFQHQWQYRSGRLGPDTQTSGRIDPDAPWGYGNYALSAPDWFVTSPPPGSDPAIAMTYRNRAGNVQQTHAITVFRLTVPLAAGRSLSGVVLPDFGPSLISGSVIVETIFQWDGIGRLYIDSIFARDYPTVLGLTVATAIVTLLASLAADILYVLADPRIRVGEEAR